MPSLFSKSAWILAVLVAACGTVRIAPPTQPTVKVDEEIRDLIELVNDHRDDIGCKDLEWYRPLAQVAQRHSDDMTRRNFFNHRNPDGLNSFKRIEAAGIRYWKAAENIAAGQRTAKQVFESWLKSPGHRRNIEDCEFREHGIGLSVGITTNAYGVITYAWTHNFVRLRQ